MMKNKTLFMGAICLVSLLTLFHPGTVHAQECVSNDENGDYISEQYVPADQQSVLQVTASNKKGIQGTEYAVSRTLDINGHQYVQSADEDPKGLGINHVLLNFDISQFLASDSTPSDEVISYNYNGTEYRFNKKYIYPFLYRIRQYQTLDQSITDRQVAVTMVLLFSRPSDGKYNYLMNDEALKNDGSLHMFYGVNMENEQARMTVGAVFNYLTTAFGDKEHFVQNWILGNEVDVPGVYNYLANQNASYNAKIYVEEFQVLSACLQVNSPYAKPYISLTNRWNTTSGGKGFGAKQFLDLFSKYMGNTNWNVAMHAYDPNLKYKMWDMETQGYISYANDSPYMCALNLDYITNYIAETYGNNHRMILSEQGFNVRSNTTNEQYEQAAELAYTYYKAAANPMVDAVIFNNWYDNSYQADLKGLHIGLHSDDGTKREAYYAFKYMDTDRSKILKYADYLKQKLYQ